MMRLKFILLCAGFIIISATSCKTFFQAAYGFNKKFKFNTRNSYLTFLQGKKGIDSTQVIYPDSNSRSFFLNSIMTDSLSVYYACLLNDSTELVKSIQLKENLSCMGRILVDIKNGISGLTMIDSSLVLKSEFKKYRFTFLHNNRQVNFNESEKKIKIIMLYGYALGNYFDRTFKEVRRFHEGHKEATALYVITMDNIYQLQ